MILNDKINRIPSSIIQKALDQAGLGVTAVYLLGSYATDFQREDSDIDLAVLAPVAFSFDELMRLSVALQIEFEGRNLDLADLRSVNTVFAAQVITNGRRILTMDEVAADRFEMLTLSKGVKGHLLGSIWQGIEPLMCINAFSCYLDIDCSG
ncbi:MAG: nucleotidyltransferase domain-containing protein [Gallionellaceae bacterium]|jgi:predicted nucleotidyltransferase